DFPLALGCAIWLRHVLEAERNTRGARRVFVQYRDLLQHSTQTAEFVASQLADNWQVSDDARRREVASFIDPEMRHHRAETEELRRSPGFYAWIAGAWDAFSAVGHNQSDAKALRRLDKIRVEFDSVVSAITPLVEAGEVLGKACANLQGELSGTEEARKHYRAAL